MDIIADRVSKREFGTISVANVEDLVSLTDMLLLSSAFLLFEGSRGGLLKCR